MLRRDWLTLLLSDLKCTNSEVYLAEKMDRYLGDNWKSFTSVLLESSKLCWNQDEVCCRLPACYPH
uniref:Uncharacterized protein n=1 Tax=Zea mays TaxID=4577 RepID=A0A804MTI5_MAIZE